MVRWKLLLILTVATLASREACAQAPADPYRISLRNVAPFTPDPGVRLQLPERDSNPRNVHVLVQLEVNELARAREGGDSQETLRRLFTANPADNPALRILANLQRSTYEAVISRTLAERLIRERSLTPLDDDAERFVRWIGSMPPEAKVEPELREGRYRPWALGPGDTFRLLVTFHEDAVSQAEALLGDLAVEHVRYANDSWVVILPTDRFDRLVADDSVRSVGSGPMGFIPLNDSVRSAIGVDAVQNVSVLSNPPMYAGLTGAGIAVAVMEGAGIDVNHDDFWEHDQFGHRTVLRILHHTGQMPTTMHGTHVTGIIAGNGYQSTRNNANNQPNGDASTDPYEWRGMAPRATILAFENVQSGGDAQTQYDATVVAGADVSNDSHIQDKCLLYDIAAANIDALVRGDFAFDGTPIPPRAAVWAAGNNGAATEGWCFNYGYFGLTVAAKNAIVVGGINADGSHYRDSSLGPTYDGRLKPDVVAPGCKSDGSGGIKSSATRDPDPVYNAVPNGYARDCGTSMAAAVVTGTIALLLEKWRQEFGATTGCLFTSGGECFPLPSTLKAALIQGATDIIDASERRKIEGPVPVQARKGPDYITGYGSINAVASVELVDAGPGLARRIVEADIVGTNMPDEYFVVVPMGAQRLRVTLAWDDEQGSVFQQPTDKQLKNDLDLELSASGTTHLPWIAPALTPHFEGSLHVEPDSAILGQLGPATTGIDEVNNVEQVEVEGPAAGTWTVRVKGNKLGPGKSQRYSLVSDFAIGSGIALPPPPLTTPAPPTNLCVDMEWRPTSGSGARGFQFDFPPRGACGSVPLDPICRYVLGCPGCAIFGLCADLRVRLLRLPDVFRVSIRRRDGSIVASDTRAPDGARIIAWRPVAGEKYGLSFEAAAGTRPSGTEAVEASLEALR